MSFKTLPPLLQFFFCKAFVLCDCAPALMSSPFAPKTCFPGVFFTHYFSLLCVATKCTRNISPPLSPPWTAIPILTLTIIKTIAMEMGMPIMVMIIFTKVNGAKAWDRPWSSFQLSKEIYKGIFLLLMNILWRNELTMIVLMYSLACCRCCSVPLAIYTSPSFLVTFAPVWVLMSRRLSPPLPITKPL